MLWKVGIFPSDRCHLYGSMIPSTVRLITSTKIPYKTLEICRIYIHGILFFSKSRMIIIYFIIFLLFSFASMVEIVYLCVYNISWHQLICAAFVWNFRSCCKCWSSCGFDARGISTYSSRRKKVSLNQSCYILLWNFGWSAF